MPIAREHRWLYPIDWRELSAFIRFDRAKGRCEHCRRPHGRDVLHLGDGRWWDEDAGRWRDGQGRAGGFAACPRLRTSCGLNLGSPALTRPTRSGSRAWFSPART